MDGRNRNCPPSWEHLLDSQLLLAPSLVFLHYHSETNHNKLKPRKHSPRISILVLCSVYALEDVPTGLESLVSSQFGNHCCNSLKKNEMWEKWLRDLNYKQRKSFGVSVISQDVALTQLDIPKVKTTVRGWRDGPEVKNASCSYRDPS